MADAASMVISGSFLPQEIQKKFLGGAYEYTPADGTESWYYKLTDITTGSLDLIIAGHSYMQFGSTAQGRDADEAMPLTADADIVKFLYIKHTGYEDDGTTANTADSIYLCTDASAAAHNNAVCVEIGPNETWFAKLNCPLTSLHVIAAQKAKGGGVANKVQAVVAAIIDDVA